MSNLVPSTTPQQSARGFVSPTSMPIRKTPDITDIIGETKKNEPLIINNEPLVNQPLDQHLEPNENLTVLPSYDLTVSPAATSDFPTHWRTLFNQVFASVPTIYIPLKESLPEIENNIIKVTVKNDIQKEHFEAKTREVLEFLRTHFDEKIEDVIVETNEQLETKKIIYDVKEKLQNFKEQNPEIEDFMQILDLKIKD